jgi:hypothetical protein
MSRFVPQNMDLFTDIPKLVLLCFSILAGIGAVAFIISLGFENPGKSSENLDNLSGAVLKFKLFIQLDNEQR